MQFDIGNEDIIKLDVVCMEDRKRLEAISFLCPKCGTEHIVQLDDDNSRELLNKSIELMGKKVALSKQGKNVNNRQKRAFNNMRKMLTVYRAELMVKYNGKEFYKYHDREEIFTLDCVMGEMLNA